MKYHTTDEREFRTLGRAMEHVQKCQPDADELYWVRADQVHSDEITLEAYEAHTLNSIHEELPPRAVIVRK